MKVRARLRNDDDAACERVQNERFVGAFSFAIRRSALGLLRPPENLTQ